MGEAPFIARHAGDGRQRCCRIAAAGSPGRAGDAVMSFSLMGWSVQPQAHVQFVTRAVDGKQAARAILDAPRWRLAVEESAIVLEPDLAARIGADLEHRGQTLISTERFTPFGSYLMFGGANLIEQVKDGYIAASDPRRDGAAVGF